MAMNLIRRDRRDVPAQRRPQEWSPFRMMDELFRWEPFAGLERMQQTGADFLPNFDVRESKDAYVVEADLPGVKEDNVEISLTGNVLQISGRREDERKEEGDQWYVVERNYGTFTRSFTLPDGADAENVKAEMKNGVLNIQIPKKAEVQPKRISIGASEKPKTKA